MQPVPPRLNLLNPEKPWAGNSQGLFCRVYVMKCSSQLAAPAIFTPGALELWGCRWSNAGVISSMSLIIYIELITLGWQFLLTQNCRCTKEKWILNVWPPKSQRENGAFWGWLSSRHAPGKAMSFIATTGFWELTSNLKWWLTIATVAKVILLDSHKILFLICILQKKFSHFAVVIVEENLGNENPMSRSYHLGLISPGKLKVLEITLLEILINSTFRTSRWIWFQCHYQYITSFFFI